MQSRIQHYRQDQLQDARQAIIFLQAPPLAVLLVAKAPLLGYIATARAMRICLVT
jgi:hypothetical protein